MTVSHVEEAIDDKTEGVETLVGVCCPEKLLRGQFASKKPIAQFPRAR